MTIKENEILSSISFTDIDNTTNAKASTIIDNLASNINWKASQVACNVAQYPSMKFEKTEKQFTLK